MTNPVRIGIDVGGTFTHAVAVDGLTYELLGKVCVPTTHHEPEGVAAGIVQAFRQLLTSLGLQPGQVTFIAHSTTQATNAMLEGDVATVGIVGMGDGLEGLKAKADTNVGAIELSPGKMLPTLHLFIDSKQVTEARVAEAIRSLQAEGAQVIVAAEAFSVDDPTREQLVQRSADGLALPGTATHEISQLYGLRVRTRTAVVNGSILPKMIETAVMTEESVKAAGITAPLMIMRSDGGVMDAEQMRRRPIMTVLSGPAAGIAAALMFLRVSDGVFLEVGGTSTDIALIQTGKPKIRPASIGGHKTFLTTLDSRTLGIAGGSMIRLSNEGVSDVGPRSAHIAGLPYACFAHPAELEGARVVRIQPKPGDPTDYAILESPTGKRFAVTTTCAANAFGAVQESDHSYSNQAAAKLALAILGREVGMDGTAIAQSVLDIAAAKVEATVNELIADYQMPREILTLVGGGGGAAAIVRHLGQRMQRPVRIAEHAEVISAIGCALAMVREVIERTVPNPSDADVIRIRREVEEAVIRLGAVPDSIEVQVEVDAQRNILRAIGTGATEFRARSLSDRQASDEERKQAAAASLNLPIDQVHRLTGDGFQEVYAASVEERKLFGLIRNRRSPVRVVDAEGVVRLQLANGRFVTAVSGEILPQLGALVDEHTLYGDGGTKLPDIYLLFKGKLVNLSGLPTLDRVRSLAQLELEALDPATPAVALIGL